MISAIDRHFGFSGGETLTLATLLALTIWLACPHLPETTRYFAHACVALNR